jgi:hypothetical protein
MKIHLQGNRCSPSAQTGSSERRKIPLNGGQGGLNGGVIEGNEKGPTLKRRELDASHWISVFSAASPGYSIFTSILYKNLYPSGFSLSGAPATGLHRRGGSRNHLQRCAFHGTQNSM